jgi:multisubunit Na+/H+ antiporter MnhB subunit
MGASRGRIVQQLLIEASLIALLAAVLGTAIAAGAIQALVALGPDSVPRLDELSLDWRILAFAVATALATMALFGLMPAVQAARHDPQDALRVEGRGTVSSTSRARLRGLVMVGEVALSVALLIGAGLLIRSFSRLQEVDPGFAARRVMTARVNLPGAAYPTAVSRRQFYERFLADLQGRPGIEAERAAAERRLHRWRREAAVAEQRRGCLHCVADRRPRLLRRARHPAARARVLTAGRGRPAGGHHQRDAGGKVLPQRRPARPDDRHAQLR